MQFHTLPVPYCTLNHAINYESSTEYAYQWHAPLPTLILYVRLMLGGDTLRFPFPLNWSSYGALCHALPLH